MPRPLAAQSGASLTNCLSHAWGSARDDVEVRGNIGAAVDVHTAVAPTSLCARRALDFMVNEAELIHRGELQQMAVRGDARGRHVSQPMEMGEGARLGNV